MTATARPFDPLTVPVSGTNLIEASAGTGKTYGIAALFTRLIVLEQMPVESVLVVTFTKAATAELKTRLRARLDNVLQVLEQSGGDPEAAEACCAREYPGDAFLPELLRQSLAQEGCARLIVRLKAAIGQFDNAAIYTIHGFCQRILRDYAFLCRAPFDVELAEESRERLLVPAQDFWRSRISNQADLARLVFKHSQTPQKMLGQIQSFISRPYLVFRRPKADLAGSRRRAEARWQAVRSRLPELEAAFWQLHPALNGNSYRKNTFAALFAELHAAGDALPAYHDKLPMLAADALAAKVKKGQTPDEHTIAALQPLADLGEALAAAAEAEQNTLTCLQLDLLEYVNAALAEQKKSRRERGFDDLLLDVHAALTDAQYGGALAEAVARNWRVALIDEFQDTDPLQYEIFRRMFIEQARPLFLVGDPKQAIYSFRGADIYAYLQAAADAESRYTLAVNYRSHAKLVNSIGALFRQKTRPFVLADIDYADVGAARPASRLNPPRPAVQVRWLHGGSGEPVNKDMLRQHAADCCADEIAAALNEAAASRLNFKERPLQSGDIAVLVRTHNEGSLVAKALKARRIQSVLLHRESVFATEEAAALAALIGFWLDPGQTETLRFVLGSIVFRYDAAQLYALNRDESALLAWIASAAEAADTWQQQGFYAAMQDFSARHGLETGLLADGLERSLTNYNQLLELLAAEDEQSHSPAALHQWLLAQISLAEGGSAGGESNTVRLESDEALVKIVTMHASKGLQYPLVYCPFVWDASAIKAQEWQILHRPGHITELLADHQLDDADKIQLGDEAAAENLRLLYVALTRAEEQLNIYAAYCGDTADNTFAYLLEGRADADRESVKAAYKENKAPEALQMLKRNWLRFIQAQQQADTEIVFTEETPPKALADNTRHIQTAYRAADIPPRRFELIRHSSFTGLSRKLKAEDTAHEALQPALDPGESASDAPLPPAAAANAPSTPEGIHTFPRGTHAGVCLHEILEHFDFQTPAAAQNQAAAETLSRYGFEESWLDAVTDTLDDCRLTPLSGAYALADIPPRNRLAEMGFTLYMQDFSLPRLRRWFARPEHGLPAECADAAELLDFKTLHGFLNGFIDMVCQDADGRVCVIDYKSNHLGNDRSAYSVDAMNHAVAHHHYYLQALIYAVAVARHFKLRGQSLPEISIRYLFLRGLDGSENGVWRWDIPADALAEWV
ncbi:exodeoxyribonuclease V subunit beta [Bergeriella denitrificans]|uniref:RecBCD enzyme subunit RecB n=1 Tax=Bergeriella denitrificans TaxID=494 RepID=A0A378UG18_BERDE|nr:exodeoxyribonuclease V subunit beta [Bergeriella denitrificans]STZ76245.1 exodeoxyribonuclease V subunit beta [Bergeriella denitrificans]